MKEGPKRATAVGMAACNHLSSNDCTKHPNCQWVKEFERKTGKKVAARCGEKARPTGTVGTAYKQAKRKSPVRAAGARTAAAKNPWLAHVKRVRATLPAGTQYKDVLKAAKGSYVKQEGAGRRHW